MFEVGFIELVGLVPGRADRFLAGDLVPALFERAVVLTVADFDRPFAALFVAPVCRDVSADGATTWVRFAGAADTSTRGAGGPAATSFVAAFLAGDVLAPAFGAAGFRDLDRLATGRVAAEDVAGSVARARAGCLVLEPNAAWMVANASSSESWRVSTVTFIRPPGSGESGDVRTQMSDPR